MKKKLHVLFLCSWYPSKVNPLNGDFVQRHAEAVATIHKVSVLHIISDENLKKGIEIEKWTKNNIKTTIAYIPRSHNFIHKIYLFIVAYKKCLEQIDRYDIIHLNVINLRTIIVLYLKWIKKKSYIITEHWTRYLYPNNKSIKTIERFILKVIAKNASFICPVSNNLKENMIDLGLHGNYTIVPNVVDTNVFKPSNFNSKSFTITHISNMRNDHKNIIGILNTIKELQDVIPNLNFNFIGHHSENYEAIIKKNNINSINIIGQIEHSDIAEYLKKSDLFILFSNYENLPCVILESFAT